MCASLCLHRNRGCFPKCFVHTPVHVCVDLVGSEFQGRVRRNCGCLWVPPSLPPKKTLQAQTIRLFFVSDELFICVHLIISCFSVFFLVKLHYLKNHCDLFPFIIHIHILQTVLYCILHSCLFSFTWPALCDILGRYSFLLLVFSLLLCVRLTHQVTLSCESTAKDLSLSLFLSGQTDTTVWGCVEDYGIATLWCGEAGDVAA